MAETPGEADGTGGRMHLLDHLEELRQRLIRIIIAVAVFAVLGYIVSPITFRLLTLGIPDGSEDIALSNRTETDETFYSEAAFILGTDEKKRTEALLGVIKEITSSQHNQGGTEAKLVEKVKTVLDTDNENRAEKFISLVEAVSAQAENGASSAGNPDGGEPNIIVTTPMGPVITKLRLAGMTGLILAIPVFFFQTWKFILPALKVKERNTILPFTLGSTFFFLLGAGFSYSILPILFIFFGSVSAQMLMNQQWIADDYISFIFKLMLAGGVVFQLPVMVYFLSKLGILQPETLRKHRRHALVICFVVAAALTPPDPVSQLAMALPLFCLFELSIWISYFVTKKKRGLA